ncbi:hypothetical protein BKA80DRAFT_258812 [Phyllosticta citrichinensis]
MTNEEETDGRIHLSCRSGRSRWMQGAIRHAEDRAATEGCRRRALMRGRAPSSSGLAVICLSVTLSNPDPPRTAGCRWLEERSSRTTGRGDATDRQTGRPTDRANASTTQTRRATKTIRLFVDTWVNCGTGSNQPRLTGVSKKTAGQSDEGGPMNQG